MLLLKQLTQECEEICICLSENQQLLSRLLKYLQIHLPDLASTRDKSLINCLFLILDILNNLLRFDLLKQPNSKSFMNHVLMNLEHVIGVLEEENEQTINANQKAFLLNSFLTSITFLCNKEEHDKFYGTALQDIYKVVRFFLLNHSDIRALPAIPFSQKSDPFHSKNNLPFQVYI
jgi:hypothetical protein